PANGPRLPSASLFASQLTASIPASDLTAGANLSITVSSPAPGGGTSSAVTLTVNNPVPSLSSISPSSVSAGSPGFTLTLTGSNFDSNTIVLNNRHVQA